MSINEVNLKGENSNVKGNTNQSTDDFRGIQRVYQKEVARVQQSRKSGAFDENSRRYLSKLLQRQLGSKHNIGSYINELRINVFEILQNNKGLTPRASKKSSLKGVNPYTIIYQI